MMRWLLLATLILSGSLYADRLQTNATADTYIYDQRNVAGTAGSFSIRMASTDAMTRMNASTTTTNYATGTTGRVGKNLDVEDRWLMRWATLDDSMRAYAPAGKSVRWDSARVVVKITTAVASGDSLTVAMYALRSTRDFVEAQATWDNYKDLNAWTTGGASSTASDIETPAIDTSITLLNSSTSMSFKIPTANIADTMNMAGVTIRSHRYGNDDGTSCAATIGSDDNATEGNRPIITVYFTEMEYPDFGGADTLLMKATSPATQCAYPIMTFDISTVTATADLENCSLYVYVNNNYVDNAEGSVNIVAGVAMKPIKIGTGTGSATATGKLHWASWSEHGTADSAWGTIGATNDGNVCNTSNGADDDKTADVATGMVAPTGTGWKAISIDTTGLRTYLDQSCREFAIVLNPTASITDDAWWVLSSVEGSNDPYFVINYTPAAVAGETKGTGRFGRAQDGRYLNVR